MTVEGKHCKCVGVLGELDAWDVTLLGNVDVELACDAALDIERVNRYLCIVGTCNRVLEAVRLAEVKILLALATTVHWHVVHHHFALIVLDIRDYLAVGAEVV